ncbi:MAG: SurA N-terminal domain-containing protein [Cellulosilyticaceae bacterium]
MKKFKVFVACVGLAALSLGVMGCSNASEGAEKEPTTQTSSSEKTDDTVIAKVGDASIMQADLSKEMAYIEQLLTMQFGETYKESEEAMALYKQQEELMLNYLIESELVIQSAKELGIEVTDAQVDEEIDAGKIQLGSEEAFQAFLTEQGMTEEAFREYLRENMAIGQVMEQVTKDVAVVDEDVAKYYEENKAQFTRGPGAEMSHILVEKEEDAKKIKEEFDGGKAFADLAAEYGTDGTKDTGGSLGEFIEYDSTKYDADFLAGAKDLKEGEVSGPVKTQFGYHLIKVDNIQTDEVVTPLEEVKESIKATLLQEKQYEKFSEHIAALREKTTIEIIE